MPDRSTVNHREEYDGSRPEDGEEISRKSRVPPRMIVAGLAVAFAAETEKEVHDDDDAHHLPP
jgi:hypothetical protein